MINISFDTHTFSNENKLIIQYMNPRHDGYTCQMMENKLSDGRKCHDTQLYSFTVCLKTKTQKEGRNQREGERRVFPSISQC